MGLMEMLFRRRNQEKQEFAKATSNSVSELDRRQHEVARRLHILEYETSAEVQAMKRRVEEERRHMIRRKEDQ